MLKNLRAYSPFSKPVPTFGFEFQKISKRKVNIELQHLPCQLLPSGAAFFPEQQTLLVSDLHVGKSSHFRKNGIAITARVDDNNLWKLSGDMQQTKAKTVIFLGDLFHSEMNEECGRFADFMANFEGIRWILVEGNHDILHSDFYKDAGIEMINGVWRWNDYDLSHEPHPTEALNIAGHIHPGVRMRGTARQSIRLGCFHLTAERLLMPAYGDFTGKYTIKPKKGDKIFALIDNAVVKL